MGNPFTEHPNAVGETYAEHFRVAAGFGAELLKAGAASLTHAIFPFLCTRTGSRIVGELHDILSARQPAAAPESAVLRPMDRPPALVARAVPGRSSALRPPQPCPRADLVI